MASVRCAEPGCRKRVKATERRCGKHQIEEAETPAGLTSASTELVGNEFDEEADEFRQRLAEGDYRNLFGNSLNKVIQQAAADPGLSDEIGILRVVLARILMEENDPAQLAASISRVAGVAIQAARAQQAIAEGSEEGAFEVLITALTNFDFAGHVKEGTNESGE